MSHSLFMNFRVDVMGKKEETLQVFLTCIHSLTKIGTSMKMIDLHWLTNAAYGWTYYN